jgi:hypothetical protein
MNAIQKSIGSILILGGAIGCAGDTEPASPPVQSPQVQSSPAARPSSLPPPVTIQQPPKGGDTKEMTPPGDADKSPAKPGGDGPKVEAPKTSDAAKPDTKVKLTDKELAAIKELPAAEQTAAIAQAVCPVSNKHLGGMGMPMKVTAEGRTFYLCCDSCEEELKANPKAVIAKLDKAKDAK